MEDTSELTTDGQETTASSCCARTAQSVTSMDVLALGEHLVRELDLESNSDTLARWMAHYVAELICKVANAPSEAERSVASQETCECILKIWDHRAALPGGAYPLGRYQKALAALEHLRPYWNPFLYRIPGLGRSSGYLAAGVFDTLARLVVTLVLLEGGLDESLVLPEANTDVSMLDGTETAIIECLHYWMCVLVARDYAHADGLPQEDVARSGRLEPATSVHDLLTSAIEGLEGLRASLLSDPDLDL